MSVQLTFDFKNLPKKRIRYRVPKSVNFYTLYQYDRVKYSQLLKEWLETDEGKNRTKETLIAKHKEILEQCFIKDENDNKLKDSDEKHIYRYQTLHSILKEIYNCIIWEYMTTGKIFEIGDLLISDEYETAELKGTLWKVSVKDRVIIHIKLLRLLRKGFLVSDCIKLIKKGE